MLRRIEDSGHIPEWLLFPLPHCQKHKGDPSLVLIVRADGLLEVKLLKALVIRRLPPPEFLDLKLVYAGLPAVSSPSLSILPVLAPAVDFCSWDPSGKKWFCIHFFIF